MNISNNGIPKTGRRLPREKCYLWLQMTKSGKQFEKT